MSTHLIVGDPHASPSYNNDRFTWLGRAILDIRPDTVICLGDFADMDSLCSYDRNTRSFEGRRYWRDVAATKEALANVIQPLKDHNAKRAENKKKQVAYPKMYLLGGNHDEGRITKATNLHSELDGTISIENLEYENYGWEYVPFLEPLCVDGVNYCHFFKSGNSSFYNAISGVSIGRTLLNRNHASSTVGHSHILDIASAVKPDGKRIWGLSAGCYMDFSPAYATGSDKFWWRGLIIKRNVSDGDYNFEAISIEEIKRRYGDN